LFSILSLNTKGKGILTVITVFVFAVISSIIAVKALLGTYYEYTLSGTQLFGTVAIRIDALSAWFILVINFTI